jgi:hypothetical protein
VESPQPSAPGPAVVGRQGADVRSNWLTKVFALFAGIFAARASSTACSAISMRNVEIS